MLVGRDDLPQRGGKHLCVRVFFLHLRDHGFERFDFRAEVFAARLGAFEAEAELEVLLVADEHIGQRCKFAECLGEFFLTSLPEGRAVIEVEGDERAVLLRGLCQRKAAFGRLMAHGGDQAGQVENADALLPENTLDVKIFDRQRPADLAGAVIPDTRRAQSEAGVGDVELMAIAPRTALFDVKAFKTDIPCAKLAFDKVRHRTSLDEFGQDKAFLPKARRDIQHV